MRGGGEGEGKGGGGGGAGKGTRPVPGGRLASESLEGRGCPNERKVTRRKKPRGRHRGRGDLSRKERAEDWGGVDGPENGSQAQAGP